MQASLWIPVKWIKKSTLYFSVISNTRFFLVSYFIYWEYTFCLSKVMIEYHNIGSQQKGLIIID